MTTPTGLLAWGQGGTYDAVDDRAVITALANRKQGLVVAAQITAGAGLAVSIAPGWAGVADCGDGTLAVVGSRATLSVDVPAGPATGTATYYLWCDTDPDAGSWTISVIAPSEVTGRPGIQLGTVVAPAGANLASQMTITASPPTFGEFEGVTFNTTQTGGKAYLYATKSGQLYVQSRTPNTQAGGTVTTSLQDAAHRTASGNMIIGPKWTIPAGDLTPFTHYEVWACGFAITPNPAGAFWWDLIFAPDMGGYPRPTFDGKAWPGNQRLNWEARGHIQVNDRASAFMSSLWLQCSRDTGNDTADQGPSCSRFVGAIPLNPGGTHTLYMRSSLSTVGGGARVESWSASLIRRGGADSTGQIEP